MSVNALFLFITEKIP